mmetsp:Transcript_12180/g.16280  ORF Transcript_12180/g.16280 Transcript_12180/m.16280 type:complete len:80 (+) Transcript_12180:730-969(+)
MRMRCKKHSFLWSVYISNYLEQGEMCVVEGERERERRSVTSEGEKNQGSVVVDASAETNGRDSCVGKSGVRSSSSASSA